MQTSINNKIIEIKQKINTLEKNDFLKKNPKKLPLLYAKVNDMLESISEIIEEFELNDINNFNIDKEVEMRIKENKVSKEIIDVFGPYILLYQMSKYTL